jgi:hypothetical protein
VFFLGRGNEVRCRLQENVRSSESPSIRVVGPAGLQGEEGRGATRHPAKARCRAEARRVQSREQSLPAAGGACRVQPQSRKYACLGLFFLHLAILASQRARPRRE